MHTKLYTIRMDLDPQRFDWALVRSFLAVLEAGSLMGAARRTGAQQPTLSRHIAELESQLGAPLFERTGRGVNPTAAGLAIADAARQMQQGAESLVRTLAGQRDPGHRHGAGDHQHGGGHLPAAPGAGTTAMSRSPASSWS